MEQHDSPQFQYIARMLLSWKDEHNLGLPNHPRTRFREAPALCKWNDARAVIEMGMGLHPFCKFTKRRGFEITGKDKFMSSYIEGYFWDDMVRVRGDTSQLDPIPSETFIKEGMRVVITIHPLPRVGERRDKYSPYLPKRYRDSVLQAINKSKKRIRISPVHYSDSPFSAFKRSKKF